MKSNYSVSAKSNGCVLLSGAETSGGCSGCAMRGTAGRGAAHVRAGMLTPPGQICTFLTNNNDMRGRYRALTSVQVQSRPAVGCWSAMHQRLPRLTLPHLTTSPPVVPRHSQNSVLLSGELI